MANERLTCELCQESHPLTGVRLWGQGVCWEVSLQPQRAAITEFTQVINKDAAQVTRVNASRLGTFPVCNSFKQ